MIVTYQFTHHKNFSTLLNAAKLIADYAVSTKGNLKVQTSKYVKQFGVPSAISNQILRKYGRGTIKNAKNVNLIANNQSIKYDTEKSLVTVTPLGYTFRWHAGKKINKINQIEIDNRRVYITVTSPDIPQKTIPDNRIVSVDLNSGRGRHVAVAACLHNGKTLMLGKQGPNIRDKYFKKRRRYQSDSDWITLHKMSGKENRITRDIDHKISRDIVRFAGKNNCRVVVEDLSGITRKNCKKGSGKKALNRTVSSWSFYRLQSYLEYKCQAAGIPYSKVKPHYTSQLCSYCGKLGNRKGESFICVSQNCDYHGN